MFSNHFISPKFKNYQGNIFKKPWDYQVTVVIPHIETPSLLERCVNLYKLSVPVPYILIIDTGSSEKTLNEIEKLRCENVELHYIRSHSYQHPSEPVALAMDLATLHCQTKWLFCTHSDCFLRDRYAIEELIEMSEKENNPCVGYKITPRTHWRINGEICEDWKWMVGHTFTLFDRDFLDEYEICWSLRRGSIKKQWTRDAKINNPAISPNVIDTEVFINNSLLEKANKKPFIIGEEENYIRNLNRHFDHVRSFPSAMLYLNKNDDLRTKQDIWLKEAIEEADERIIKWTSKLI
jgi:hypothetical protein